MKDIMLKKEARRRLKALIEDSKKYNPSLTKKLKKIETKIKTHE